jgi:hypothetical protein
MWPKRHRNAMDACPICDRGEPLDVIAELAAHL